MGQRASVSLKLTPYELQVVALALTLLAYPKFTPLTKIIGATKRGESVDDARRTAKDIVDQIGLK